LIPRADEPGRVPACEVLVNTEAVRDQIRDLSATLNIPDLIKEGSVAYGMQSFDQSLMDWFSRGVISYESAQFFATNPAELALRVQGVNGSSDANWDGFRGQGNPAGR
jgi:twitching motility protein PilT